MSLVTAALSSAVSLAGLPRTVAIYGTAVAAVVARRVAIGASFLTAAAFLALMREFGAIHASLGLGAAFIVIGLTVLMITRSARP
jgi:hypothetical protein